MSEPEKIYRIRRYGVDQITESADGPLVAIRLYVHHTHSGIVRLTEPDLVNL